MATGQGTGMGSGGCNKLCSAANRASLVVLFSLSVSIRTVRCNGWESCHRSYYPEHILAYGSGKTRSFRVLVSSSFCVDCMEAEIGWRSLHRIEAGLQLRGLGVLVWGGDLETSAGTEGVSLCLCEFL